MYGADYDLFGEDMSEMHSRQGRAGLGWAGLGTVTEE